MKTPYLDDSALTHVGTEPLILSGSQDVCLGFQISQLQDGRQNKQRCDCYSCVESRNIAPVFVSPSNFRDQMLQAGFSDEDATAELREHIGSDFYEDIVFLLNRIHSLPPERPTHLSVAPNLENFLFNRSIGELRTERRTRPASERGDGAIRYGAMFSVQQKNQKAENNRNPEPFDTRKLGYCGVSAKYDGIAVPIWYRPDHFVFAKTADEAQSQFEARVFAKPQVGEHVVMVGDVRVPIDDIYSQGAFKALVDGKEMTVTDFWAVKYKSGWRGFVDPRIRMKNGDRQRDEFFEPTPEQIAAWRARCTNDHQFKPVERARFSKMLPKRLFKNHGDEVPMPPKRTWIRNENFDFTNPYGFSKPTRSWSLDLKFIFELTRIFPSLKLAVYSGGENLQIEIPMLRPPKRLFAPYCTLFIPPVWANENGRFYWRDRFKSTKDAPLCPTYLINRSEVGAIELLHSSVGVDFDGASDLGLTESHRQKRNLFELLRQPTEKELLHGEQMLKNAEDYDRKQHARFAHFYEYGYRYLPGELILDGRSFNPIKNTTITKTADTPQTLQMIWNTAIENTFGRFRDDAPPNGFYVRYKINLLTPTRVHLIMPTNPIGVDLGDEGNDESPATFGQDEINTQIKFTAVAVRSRTRKLETLKKNLRERIVEDRNMMVYISFHLNDRELRYTLGDTSHIPPKPIESVSSSR